MARPSSVLPRRAVMWRQHRLPLGRVAINIMRDGGIASEISENNQRHRKNMASIGRRLRRLALLASYHALPRCARTKIVRRLGRNVIMSMIVSSRAPI